MSPEEQRSAAAAAAAAVTNAIAGFRVACALEVWKSQNHFYTQTKPTTKTNKLRCVAKMPGERIEAYIECVFFFFSRTRRATLRWTHDVPTRLQDRCLCMLNEHVFTFEQQEWGSFGFGFFLPSQQIRLSNIILFYYKAISLRVFIATIYFCNIFHKSIPILHYAHTSKMATVQ